MSNHHEWNDRRQLDRLVDGELVDDEYRALLARLDQDPDGWRRCAMAFLEAQAFRQELGRLAEDTRGGLQAATSQLASRGRGNGSTWRFTGLLLAVAASVAVAFAGGVWWQESRSPGPPSGLATMTRDNSAPRVTGTEKETLQERDRPPASDNAATEHVTFVVNRDGGERERFELPVYHANDRFARQLLQGSPSLPADVEQAIRDSGFEFKRQREWARVRLRDGRRAIFPIDQLEVAPVSGNIYH